MARFAVFDDFEVYAEMAAAPLRLRGHEVLQVVTEQEPIDFERVVAFRPQALAVGLYRNEEAFDRPIQDWTKDVLGWKPLTEMERYPAINVLPILLAANAVRERDIPTTVDYDVFLVLPKDIKLYVPKLEELATKLKTRRKISPYICPHCGSRLGYLKEPAQDLFCARCHTAVSIIDGTGGIMMVEGTRPSEQVTMDQLTPRQGESSTGAQKRSESRKR